MLIKKLIILNKLGLHARASMKLINLAARFQSSVVIRYQEYEADAKDIINVMALGAAQGSEIELITSGADENSAMEKISELINNRFGES
ncbi:MAG: HPr family phosphocarrier protein [Proteobacteria bacterium]|nr:HPr family phosphocarrier protein [Pseudomonadota bacterium]